MEAGDSARADPLGLGLDPSRWVGLVEVWRKEGGTVRGLRIDRGVEKGHHAKLERTRLD